MAIVNLKMLTLPELFEVQVERSPDAIALEFEGHVLTYSQLNNRANALAHYLYTLRAEPNPLIGICLNRSMDMVIALLAILKAGAAYLPLDPSYPRDRLAYMVINSGSPIILTERSCASLLPTDKVDAQVVLLDKMGPHLCHQHSTENLDLRIGRDDLASTIYTSGSTGNPKGVAMPHGPLVNLIHWQMAASAVKKGRTLQFSPISFDVSFQEIFATLSTGGTLVLISDDTRRDPYQLIEVLHHCAIERLFLPFVALNQLATTAVQSQAPPLALKEVITAGEQLRTTPALVQWFEQMPDCSLHNHYGPSESHVVTAYRLNDNPHDWPLLPSIGSALPYVKLYVLDSGLQPVESGELGELYLGGDCLAHGYLHRPDITAERFLTDPFDPDPAARMYKTGDLVRQGIDGNLECIGRADSQVKIRGFRVELGGVEAALTSSPDIRAAAAVARPDVSGSLQLIAYVVPQERGQSATASAECSPAKGTHQFSLPETHPPQSPLSKGGSSGPPPCKGGVRGGNSTDSIFLRGCTEGQGRSLIPQLRAYLSEQLPSYMVPTQFVVMDALPLTPNDKVDRKALPDPDWNTVNTNARWVAPTTKTEQTLAEIWSQLLQVKPIGKTDNFLDLGGHSLLGAKLMTQLRMVFDVRLSLLALTRCSRLDQMAQLVDRQLQHRQRQAIDSAQALFRRKLELDVDTPMDAWTDDVCLDDGRWGEFIEEDSIEEQWTEQDPGRNLDDHADQDDILAAEITGDGKTARAHGGVDRDTVDHDTVDHDKMVLPSTLEHVFLTGATGLVGGFLLHELLTQTEAHIHCLVREHTSIDARYKLERYLTQCQIPWQSFGDRIHVLPGDLSRPLLGLTQAQFDWLAQHVDTIYHSGAQTNHIYPYPMLRGANVQGTIEVLRLASTSKLKAVHHLSTLDVLQSPVFGEEQILSEALALPPRSTLATGYARTKWVAERLVATAGDRGIPTQIYRLGMTTGHSLSGYTNPNDMVARLLRGLVQMQSAPDNEFALSFTPVDQVAKALVALAKNNPRQVSGLAKAGATPTFHVAQTTAVSLQEIVHRLQQQGYVIDIVAYEEWLERLYLDVENPMYPFLEDLDTTASVPNFFKALDLSQVSTHSFVQQLQQRSMEWPEFSSDILPRYINHLAETGHLPAPAQAIAIDAGGRRSR